MKISPLDYEIIETESFGEIGCGKVVPFSYPTKIKIATAKGLSVHPKTYIASGDSLKDRGINHGDVMICKTNFSIYEVTNKVCVVYLFGEYLAKIIVPNSDGSITLKSANPYYGDKRIEGANIEIVGIVKQIQRSIE